MTFSSPDTAVWAREFLRDLLERWRVSVNPNGLFHPDLDREWNRLPSPARTLVSQCRLIYNFSRGFELFDDSRFADAAAAGLHALMHHFQIAPGQFRWSVTENGAELDATPDAYGHAFVILAQATAARVLGTDASAAWKTWEYVESNLTDARGGLIWRGQKSQNPVMHSFEALMTLCAADKTGRAQGAAQKMLSFVQTLENFGAGKLIERFEENWTPAPVENGGILDLGHACEWAFLLSEWSLLTGEMRWLELGAKFLETGVTLGLDTDGGLRAACAPNRTMTVTHKGLWQQCEAVRALHRYARMQGNSNFDDAFAHALGFYQTRFVDSQHGGVFASLDSTRKGDAWKLDYHSVNLCLELCGEMLFKGNER